jgi:predicted metallopeptidase
MYRVYGISGMLAGDLNLSPDYSKSAEDIYEEFARASISDRITVDKTLYILQLCEMQNSSSSLPSWVPNLSADKHT